MFVVGYRTAEKLHQKRDMQLIPVIQMIWQPSIAILSFNVKVNSHRSVVRSCPKKFNNQKSIFLEFRLVMGVEKKNSCFPGRKDASPFSLCSNIFFIINLILFCKNKSSGKLFIVVFMTVVLINRTIKMFKLNIFISCNLAPD